MDIEMVMGIIVAVLMFCLLMILLLWAISSSNQNDKKEHKKIKKVIVPDKAKPKKIKPFGAYSEKGQAIFLLIILILFAVGYFALTILVCFIQGKQYYLGSFLFLLMAMFFAPYKKEVSRAFKRIYEADKPKEQKPSQDLKEQIKKELLEELKQEEQEEE
ncbi:MAG TPA: hypothetical protein PKV66_05200 [Candidatus Pelethenecus sp.]|nr:hypothetical protein [Candidatus Pelethenecus sp.]